MTKVSDLISDCYSCSKCIHYCDCADYDFDCDDLNWTYTYASENDKEIRKNG